MHLVLKVTLWIQIFEIGMRHKIANSMKEKLECGILESSLPSVKVFYTSKVHYDIFGST